MRVLIVEGEPPVAALLRDHLIELGHAPVVAADGTDALRILGGESVDAILLALNLPDVRSADFLQLPALRERAIPVVVVADAASEAQAQACIQLGALDVVPKPIPAERLSEVVGFLELHLLNKQLVDQVKKLDRRRFPRVPATFPVRVMEYAGNEWLATAVDLSPFGLKVRANLRLADGAAVKLHFSPPDGPPSITLLSVLVRVDDDGFAFCFVNLTKAEFQRLSSVVQALVSRQAVAPPA
jgi:CheY-like chemotaxis protein